MGEISPTNIGGLFTQNGIDLMGSHDSWHLSIKNPPVAWELNMQKKGFNSLIMDGVSENDGIWYTPKQIQILWTMTTNDKPLDLGVQYPILKQPKTRFLID